MKNTIYFFSLITILSLTACEGPMGPPGQDGQDGWANIYVQYYTIKSWTLSENGTFFYADVDCPQLTKFVYDDGVTMAYIATKENNILVQNPLPWDLYRSNDANEIFWTETISFDITQGHVRFYYEPSDFVTETTPPQCEFKVVLMW